MKELLDSIFKSDDFCREDLAQQFEINDLMQVNKMNASSLISESMYSDDSNLDLMCLIENNQLSPSALKGIKHEFINQDPL